MDLSNEDIESITNAVWESIVGAHLDPQPNDASHKGSLTGTVELSGAYEGLVSVEIDDALVRGAASVMFQMPADQVSIDEMTDAVAELTNMVGGNIKCLVEQPSKLGLPSVNTREDHIERKDLEVIRSLSLGNESGRVVVRVHERAL